MFFATACFTARAQTITTIAGSGVSGGAPSVYCCDGGPATDATISLPWGVATDGRGNVYFVDWYVQGVRKIDASGLITTIAGVSTYFGGFSGDGGPATAAEMRAPFTIAADVYGNVYIADYDNYRIRKVDTSGIINTIAGNGTPGYSGDGGPATAAEIAGILGIAVDGAGNLYIGDSTHIRKINTSGIITTIAGNGTIGYIGDGGPATAAEIYWGGIAVDGAGNVYLSVYTGAHAAGGGNYRVRIIDTAGIIHTFAGTGTAGHSGDGSPATAAQINGGYGIAADAYGNIYIADEEDYIIRKVDPSGIITTFAGAGTTGFSGDGGPAISATFDFPMGLAVDGAGNMYISDWDNYRIRKISGRNHPPAFTGGHSLALTVCAYSAGDSISAILAAHDSDYAQVETWSLLSGPAHGTAAMPGTAVANGHIVTPYGLFYTPVAGYSGADSFRVRVTDGYASDTATVYVTVVPEALTITGTLHVCAGSTTALGDTITGGAWSSSGSAGIATVNGAGIVTGISAGIATISYSAGLSCGLAVYATTVTVNTVPSAIAGNTSVCTGLTTALSDTVTGGTWSSSNAAVATVGTSGIVTAIIPGTTVITYTLTGGCAATKTVTVNPASSIITGPAGVCVGSTISLSDATAGGAWSSSATGVATIGSASGVVSGLVTGITTISYIQSGCPATLNVTVNPVPSYITGVGTLCLGLTTTLNDGIAGGTWTSGSPGVATVGGATGLVTAVAPGSTLMTYTLPTGCAASTALAVYPLPGSITGSTGVCIGATTTLSDSTIGGTWSSENPSVATIDLYTGVATGVASGIAIVTYTSGSNCTVITFVTVNPSPGTISGTPYICPGDVTHYSDATGGGAWSTSSTAVATITPVAGNLTGVSGGVVEVIYSLAGCSSEYTLIVNTGPAPITGSLGICGGLTSTLHDTTAGGAWSSGNPGVATVTGGTVRGIAAGTAIITYALPSGCIATAMVTVNSFTAAITGTMNVCVGATTSLGDASRGGTWSSGSPSVATIGTVSGVVSGLAPGTTTITYSLGAGCSVSAVVTVNPLPSGITGIANVCAGATTALTDPSGGGTWSAAGGSIATAGPTGVVTGVATGSTTIIYTLPTGCAAVKTVTVNPLPSVITGTLSLCPGTTTALHDSTIGGTWSPATGGIATVSPTGVVNGVSTGTATISYTIGTGCTRAMTVTVNPLPAVPIAIGSALAAVCVGATVTLTDGTSGGTWSTTSTSLATIGSTGVVTGLASGPATISYTLGTGCARTTTVTVNPLPGAIAGPAAVCVGATISETDGGGGTWISGTTTVATVTPGPAGGGVVTGVALGNAVITYTLPTGCATNTTVSVSLSPAGISGASSVCAGDTVILTDAVSGGAWSSSNTTAATAGSLNGVISGVSPGTTTITYSLGTGCTVTKTITVNASPAIPTVGTGPASVCSGSTIILRDVTTGGTWSPATGSVATVNTTGVVTGVGAGTATISYTVGGCVATAIITVNPTPTAITGSSTVCAGATINLGNSVGGGTWASSNTAVATAGTSGSVSGASGGTANITYSIGGCLVTKAITVNPIAAITGATGVCVGATTTLSDVTTGGTWSPATGATANVVPATGVVTGIASGTAAMTYTTAAGCVATTTVTVNLAPSGITGNLHVCVGATTALSDAAGGGTWVSGNLSVATVPIAIGTVAGVSPGTSVITYSLGSGCTVSATVTVNPSPSPILGVGMVCAGSTTALSDPGGGTWNSGSITVATVTGAGVVTGVGQGVATITYTPGTGCFATKIVTVDPKPSAITGTTNVCVGLTTTLSDTTIGGTWTSSNAGVATVTPIAIGTGVVGGAGAGTATITYALPTGCMTTASVLVNSAPGAIFGTMNMCVGSATTLSDPTSGGTWSVATGVAATVNSAGVVTGVSLGMAAVSYVVGGCPAIATVTVNSLPPAISGDMNVCVGSATSLSDAAAGGTWSSAAGSGMVMVGGTGVVTGEGTGTAAITYSLGVGCNAFAMVTVNTLPSAPTVVGGVDNICKGATAVVTDGTVGGSWSMGDISIATITTGGVVLGLSGGGVTISYTLGTGCAATTIISVTAVPSITGITHLCALGDTGHVYDAMPGGTWSSTLAPVSADGLVTGFGAGTATVTYTLGSGCFAAAPITVNPAPAAIGGVANFCIGTTTALTETATGGVWSPATGSIATVSAAGIVSGVSAGVVIISYTLPGTGCMATAVVTVDAHPSAITGSGNVCVSATAALGDTVSGGAWSSSSASIATADVGSGVITGVSAGTATITYYLSAGCAATRIITVNPLPTAYTITGGGNYCSGTSGVHIGLSGADDGITYKLYRSTTLAGTITGPAADFGLETIAGTYKVVAINAATTCGRNMPDSVTITVTPSVVPGVSVVASPANTVCAGTPVTFTATPVNGGTPVYQWMVNGGSVGSGGATYSYTPSDNDLVGIEMTSSETCAIPATVSDSVMMVVVTPVIPTVTINATPGTNVQPGESVTFTASVANGGTSPTYQWEINSSPVAGATEATFINSFNITDTVTCVVSAGGVCNPEGSNSVVTVVSNVGVVALPGLPEGEVVVLPNPNDGEFVVRGSLGNSDETVSLEITDMLGQVVYRDVVVAKGGKLDERIILSNPSAGLRMTGANGVYLLSVRSVSVNEVFHIVIER